MNSRRNINSGLILGGLLFLACVVRLPAINVSATMEALFRLAASVSLIFLIVGPSRVGRIEWWVIAFYLLSVFSVVYPVGMSDVGIMTFINIQYGIIWYLAVANYVLVEDVHWLLDAMCLIVVLNVLYQTVQYYHKDFLYTPIAPPDNRTYNPLYGLMGQRNHLSSLIAECFPAFLRKGWWPLIPVAVLGLYWSESMGGPVAVAIGLAIYSAIRSNTVIKACSISNKYLKAIIRVLAPVLSISVSAYMLRFISRGGDIGGRLTAWKNAWPLYKVRWRSGWGLGNWKIVFAQQRLTRGNLWWSTAHNEPYQALFEMGIGFPAVFLGFILSVIITAWQAGLANTAVPLTAIAIFVSNSCVNFIMHVAPTAMVPITWLAIFRIQSRENIEMRNGIGWKNTTPLIWMTRILRCGKMWLGYAVFRCGSLLLSQNRSSET